MRLGNVLPTRMNLINMRDKKQIAERGYSLLKKNRDAIIIELFNTLKRTKDVHNRLLTIMEKAKIIVFYTLLNHSEIEINTVANLINFDYELMVFEENIVGIKVPEIEFKRKKAEIMTLNYPLFITSASIDKLFNIYKEILSLIIENAKVEVKIKKLLKEIKRINRKVNALDYVIIPEIESNIKLIESKLEEMERDMFISLKFVKSKIERIEKD